MVERIDKSERRGSEVVVVLSICSSMIGCIFGIQTPSYMLVIQIQARSRKDLKSSVD